MSVIVYIHESLYCKYESDWTIEGVYRTKLLAYTAMRKRKLEYYTQVREDWFRYGRSYGLQRGHERQYNEFESQRIRAYEVQEEVK